MKAPGTLLLAAIVLASCSSSAEATDSASAATDGSHDSGAALSWAEIPEDTNVSAGTYALDYNAITGDPSTSLRFTFTLPAGWAKAHVDGMLWSDPVQFFLVVPDNLFADPCHPESGLRVPEIGPSVKDLTDALATVEGWRVTKADDGTYFGFPGTHLRIQPPEDTAPCSSEGKSLLLHVPGDPGYVPSANGSPLELWVIDADGTRVVVVRHLAPDPSTATLAEAESVLASIVVQP